MEGKKLAHYEVLSRLGAGGMGEVWLARDTKLEREVALKFLHATLGLDDEAEERLLREARAASALQHPGILTVHAIERVEGRSFVVMERLRGTALDEAGAELDTAEILRLVEEVADALGVAHAQGIVHRDIKPSNLFVNERGHAVVMDFGLARVQDAPQLTQSGSTVGTLGYTAPEQLVGREIGPSADVFSLGVVLYELLGKTRAFDRGQGMAGVIHDVLEKELEPLSGVDAQLSAVLARALHKDPESRFASGEELQRAIAECRGTDGGQSSASIAAPTAGTGAGSNGRPAVAASTGQDRAPLGLIAPLILGTLWLIGMVFLGLWLFRSCTDSGGASTGNVSAGAESPPLPPPVAAPMGTAWNQRRLNFFGERAEAPSLRADGRKIAFVSEGDSGAPQVFVADIDDPAPSQLTNFEEGASAPQWSPDGDWILVNRGPQPKSLSQAPPPAYAVPILGGEPRRLLERAKNLSFGSGGREIIFERSGGLFTYDTVKEETSSLPIAKDAGGASALFDRYPALSPDGKSFAYVRTLLGPLGTIELVDRATGETRTLVEGRARHSHLAFSGDGRQLLFSSDMRGAVNLWAIDLSTGARTQMTQGAGDDIDPCGTGGRIAYQNRRDDYQLVVLDVATMEETILHRWGTTIQGGRIDPAGQRVLFTSDAGRAADLYEVPMDGSAKSRRITKGEDELRLFPRWAGEDSALAYLDSAERTGLVEIKTKSGEETMLVPGWSMQTHPFAETSGDGEWISVFRITPPSLLVFKRTDGPASARTIPGLMGRLSGDGRWVVYQSFSGSIELLDLQEPNGKPVTLAPFGLQPILVPSADGKGIDAYWRVNKEKGTLADIYVLRHAEERLGALDRDAASAPEPELFVGGLTGIPSEVPTMDVATDGRIVFVRSVELSSEIWLLTAPE